MGGGASAEMHHGKTPSHGNPASTNALNTELNNVARNTDDTAEARRLVAAGADLSSTNGWLWRHTPLHQAAFHGRYQMAKTLVELGAPLHLHSNPCGRGSTGTPLELARGGGHHKIAEMLEAAMRSNQAAPRSSQAAPKKAAPNKQEQTFAKMYGTELFHQTDKATAEIILRTQEMKPGKEGLAGGGIYFATTTELTSHKAHAHGIILKAYVSLGKILTLESGGDKSMTLGKLKSQGFDSVCIARQVSSGHEYVVYDPARVLWIEQA